MDKSGDSPLIYDFNAKALKEMVFARREKYNTDNFRGVPAEIVGISDYETLQCVDVKISINDLYEERDNEILRAITLPKRFVSLPRFADFRIECPVAIGDLVRLEWAHRDLGDYLDGDGSSVDLSIAEISMLEDCWVTLDGGTRKNNNKPSKDHMIIRGKEQKITLFKNGDVHVVTSGKVYTESSGHTIKAPLTTIDGKLRVTGDSTFEGTTTTAGTVTATTGVLAQSYSGLSGGNNVMLGTVVIGGIEVNTHIHIDAEGRATQPMS